jgi:hypothetical protein
MDTRGFTWSDIFLADKDLVGMIWGQDRSKNRYRYQEYNDSQPDHPTFAPPEAAQGETPLGQWLFEKTTTVQRLQFEKLHGPCV